MAIPLKGDRSAFDVAGYATLHASDLLAVAPTVHNPTPGATGTVPVSDGAKWVAALPDAAKVTYTPAVATDWDSDADPGATDDALDQLAERVDDLEAITINVIVNLTVAHTPYTVLAVDDTLRCNAVGGAITVNLPAATGSGRILNIKKIDASAYVVTVDGSGGETIDGATTKEIGSQYDNLQIQDAAAGIWDIL
jgi:hypothetical protein